VDQQCLQVSIAALGDPTDAFFLAACPTRGVSPSNAAKWCSVPHGCNKRRCSNGATPGAEASRGWLRWSCARLLAKNATSSPRSSRRRSSVPGCIHAVDLKDRLGEIKTDRNNGHNGISLPG
jgi:hypothetical protein